MPLLKSELGRNELEFNGWVISELSALLAPGDHIFKSVSENASIRTKGEAIKRSDVYLYSDHLRKKPVFLWELKPPTVRYDDPELLQDVRTKANKLRIKYAATWNMNEAALWQISDDGNSITFQKYIGPTGVKTVESLFEKEAVLKEFVRELLDSCTILHERGRLYYRKLDSDFFVDYLSNTAIQIHSELREHLTSEVNKSKKLKDEIYSWAYNQGIPINPKNIGEFYDTFTSQYVYRMIGKVIFYNTLRRRIPSLPVLQIQDQQEFEDRLSHYWNKVREIDYQAIYSDDVLDKLSLNLPLAHQFTDFINSLLFYDFGNLPDEMLSAVFERLIPSEIRTKLGQYFTPPRVANLILGFCVRSKDDKVLDPSCGTGAFLIEAYKSMRVMGQTSHGSLLSQLWGIDIAHFPAQLSLINLYRQQIENVANFPTIITGTDGDFFDFKIGNKYEFPHPNDNRQRIYRTAEPFDAICGNPPYIHQQEMDLKDPEYKDKLQALLSKEWGKTAPISKYSDIYSYFFPHAIKCLKPGGRLGFVTSNSWLDVNFGYEMQQFLASKTKLTALIETRVEAWFKQVAVNTVVTICERAENDTPVAAENLVAFVQLKEKVPEEETQLWSDLLRHKVEVLGNSAIEQKFDEDGNPVYYDLKADRELWMFEDKTVRVRYRRQDLLKRDLDQAGMTQKWGILLRAPSVFLKIQEACKEKLVPFSVLGDVKRITAEWNDFFYLTKEQIAELGIEAKYLRPVLKSPTDSDSAYIDQSKLKKKVFFCHDNRKQLRGTKALEYIERMERVKDDDGNLWHKKRVFQSRGEHWYMLPKDKLCHVALSKSYDETFIQFFSEKPMFVDQRLYPVFFREDIDPKLFAAVMNSTPVSFIIECFGAVGLGNGALDFSTEALRNYLLIPDVRMIPKAQADEIVRMFDGLMKREVKPIEQEIKQKDREKLDKAVCKFLNLSSTDLESIYKGIVELVGNRKLLRNDRESYQEKRLKKAKLSLEEDIVQEMGQLKSKAFPENYCPPSLPEKKRVALPGTPLNFRPYLLDQYEVYSEKWTSGPLSAVDAAFLYLSSGAEVLAVDVPLDPKVTRKVLQTGLLDLMYDLDRLSRIVGTRIISFDRAEALKHEVWQKLGCQDLTPLLAVPQIESLIRDALNQARAMGWGDEKFQSAELAVEV